MARISLNIDDEAFETAGRNFDPVPAGKYKVNIYEMTIGEVKSGENKGKPRLNFQFRIQEGENAPDGSHQGNRRLFANLNAFETPNKKDPSKINQPFDVMAIGKAIGLTAQQVRDIDTDEWVGEELEVTVRHVRKQHLVDGKYVDIEPAEYREECRAFRSIGAAETAASSGEAVRSSGSKPKAGAFSL